MRGIHNYYTKLFIFILITVISSSCLISGVAIFRNVNTIHTMTEQKLLSSVKQKDKIYEGMISSLHQLSKTIGNDVEIRDYFKELRAGTKDEAFYQSLKSDLENEMSNYSGLLENAFFSFDGKCFIDGLGGSSVGYNFESDQSEWYVTVNSLKKPYLGKIKRSPITGMPVLVSAFPILDDENQILAIFALSINLNGFSSNIITNYDDMDENTIVIDETGTVVAANDTKMIYNYNIKTSIPELFHYIDHHTDGITYYERNGENYIAAFERSEVGGIIIESIPVSSYVNPIILSVVFSIIVLLIILGVVAFITYFLARSFTKPIHILVNELNDMADGNYEKEIPEYLLNRRDEFSKLGTSLSEMKYQTNQLIMKLNLANEETEASLEEVIATEEELKKQNDLLTIRDKQLTKSYEYNQAIINVLPDVIYIINREGIITDFIERPEIYSYMSKEKFINKHIKEIVDPNIASMISDKIEEAFESGVIQSFEHEFIRGADREIFEFRIVKCLDDRVIAIARNVTNQRKYQTQIEYLSYHDHLTGLYNRRSFVKELQSLDQEESLPLCIIISDVNGLKLVNDSFGHVAGDLLLTKFAKVLTEVYTEENRIFRIGGDEFVIILPNTFPEQAEELVERLNDGCSKEEVNGITLSVSFGWEIKNLIDKDINGVLKNAEDMMYKKKLFEGPSMRGRTIDIIIKTLHEKNSREEQHSHRVAELCEKLSVSLNMLEHERKEIRNAGLLHDIGKIAIQEHILNKPGKLTNEEFDEIKQHPEIGYRIICSSNDMLDIAEYILSHHERWDGKGYPRGLKGEEIPLQSRMIAIADTFDAMTSVRSYRLPVAEEEAAKEIIKNAGTQFDPDLARLFVREVLGYQDL